MHKPSPHLPTTLYNSVALTINSFIMEKLQKSLLPKIVLLALFLTLIILTPFVSTSMRSSYLYFLLNLLIVVLGVKAGFISKPHEEKKPVMANPADTVANCSTTTGYDTMLITMQPTSKPVVLEMKQERVQSLKRCKSRPSLFFIGEWEDNDEEEVKNKEEVMVVKKKVLEEDGEMSKQDLFMKAEMFIGNFYKQLKMQREKSRQKLNGL